MLNTAAYLHTTSPNLAFISPQIVAVHYHCNILLRLSGDTSICPVSRRSRKLYYRSGPFVRVR